MKKLQPFTFLFLLVLLSSNLAAQEHLNMTARPIAGAGNVSLSDTMCHAAFSAIPDSLTTFPFYYHFIDHSTGNINSWNWDFGDGFSSTETNPSHQFGQAGTYQVCLTVKNLDNINSCSDHTCQEIVTFDYFSLGGTVYTGEYPLNTPPMAGDTGIASLYRIVNDQVVFVEDRNFLDYGYYWFGFLFPGDYLIKIGLTESSAHFNGYFTTYYGNDIMWTNADLITISNSSNYAADIHLRPVQELMAGTGIIKGYVKFDQVNEASLPPVSQTNVILSDENHTPLLFTRPDVTGYFEFTGIPYGTYFLTADATGKPSTIVTFTLTENAPLVEGINLTVFGSIHSGVREELEKGIAFIRIYPNPVHDVLNVSAYSPSLANVDINIIDVTGRSYFSQHDRLQTGFNDILIPAASLPSGFYILVIQAEGASHPITGKFLK
jgi:hypothetical protein